MNMATLALVLTLLSGCCSHPKAHHFTESHHYTNLCDVVLERCAECKHHSEWWFTPCVHGGAK